jgi:glucan 1,3-beta-glucosidase
VQRYASQTDVVTSIQLLNEPFGFSLNLDGIKDFYYKGYDVVRFDPVQRDTLVVIHDAFLDFESYWNGFMGPRTSQYHVMLDVHRYQIFGQAEVNLNPTQHIQRACDDGRRLRNADKWTVVGEWTGAQTELVFFTLALVHWN